jgi:hypothetical protein
VSHLHLAEPFFFFNLKNFFLLVYICYTEGDS